MAAKLLHTLADENSDLQKKIGCMNGIFQLFDRHHLLTNRRKSHVLGNHNNSLCAFLDRVSYSLTCNAHVNSITFETNKGSATSEKLTRVSTESSRVSFSSSCSSSSLLSSELNREEAQPEISPYDRVIFPESPPSDPVMSRGDGFAAAHMGLDLRDVVRDSMYRELRGLSEVCRHKRRDDSPRPYGLKHSTPVDFNESCKALAKLRKASQHYYNEVDMRDDSHNKLISGRKVKESPKLSFDSRDQFDFKSGNSNKLSESFSRSSSMKKVSGGTKRPPSVVAKLMGLETLPVSPLGRDKTNNMFGDNTSSPRSLGKDPASSSPPPRWRNSEFVMKPSSSLRFPTEPAPWKQSDRNQFSQKQQACRPVKALLQSMEGRLKGVEFKPSGKDLRALNEIVETMQTKSVFSSRKQPQCSNSRGLQNQVIPPTMRGPIVIIKPARLVEKSGIPSSSLIPIPSLSGLTKEEESVHVKRNSTSKKPAKERSISSVDSKSSSRNVRSSQVSKESTSPRLRQVKKHENEKCSRPPTTPSDSRRQRNRQPEESTTSHGGRRSRPRAKRILQQNNDQQCSTETEAKQATKAGEGKSPTVTEAAKAVVSNLMQNVSDKHCEEDQWNPAYSFSETTTTTTLSPEINRKKLQNVEHLVQKLKRLNSNHDETSQDYIASLCENKDPNTDHRYISEILLASGLLLRDLSSELTTFQLHPSGHPINPELFLVLEQTQRRSSNEKLNRKLVFDAVNETLVKKLAFVEEGTWMKRKVLLSAQQLLKEVCSEIETLKKQTKKREGNLLLLEDQEEDFLKCILDEDVTTRSEKWIEFEDVVPGLVLDLERLLFKDLVNEIVHGEIGRLLVSSY
ncbi:unnamed protein product [Eruca vesicaria subsp. sativa]|uniref:DUF4378 domain-containing protein n=1 Tax=Eruca vesicaria subsp. sativa TaxID=29727 RepID=A0ABC8KEV0_ERUVS|nr:unnamed protein product [Eruca vesicaria subsp. sativa]